MRFTVVDMKMSTYSLTIIILLLSILSIGKCFTPNKDIELLAKLFDKEFDDDNKQQQQPLLEVAASPTLSHTEILRHGVVRSVAKYFQRKQQQAGQEVRVDLAKADTDYYRNLNALYRDYLSPSDYATVSSCDLQLDDAITKIGDAAASVDFDPVTRNLPWAHFDAERFQESNARVRGLFGEILSLIGRKQFPTARRRIGEMLHTVHDFYSHTNWVEMGRDTLNAHIGSDDLGVALASPDEIACLAEACVRVSTKCSLELEKTVELSQAIFGMRLPITCPLTFFKCSKENVIVNKLTSGYYSNQRTPNGDKVPKTRHKCSHGGYLDLTTFEDAQGGINKDTGYYYISPHADLHLKAAQLAIAHTERYFDELLEQIGEENFDELLELLHANVSKWTCFFRRLFS